jgi:hypothetical protein
MFSLNCFWRFQCEHNLLILILLIFALEYSLLLSSVGNWTEGAAFARMAISYACYLLYIQIKNFDKKVSRFWVTDPRENPSTKQEDGQRRKCTILPLCRRPVMAVTPVGDIKIVLNFVVKCNCFVRVCVPWPTLIWSAGVKNNLTTTPHIGSIMVYCGIVVSC